MLGSSPARKPSAFHFELKPGKQYNLKAFGKSYPLKAHTAGTLATCLEPGAAPTHFATVDAPPQNTVQLLRVYGPADADGIPTLESLAIYTPQSSTQTRTSDDLAKAIMFLHPSLTVLTAQLAPAVLESITSSKSFGLMSSTLAKPNKPWNTTVKLKDENGNFIKNQSGGYLY